MEDQAKYGVSKSAPIDKIVSISVLIGETIYTQRALVRSENWLRSLKNRERLLSALLAGINNQMQYDPRICPIKHI